MANYDLFIKGIRPDRMDEAEEIKKKASQFLKTEVDKLDALWGTPNGFCIRRNIEAEEAKQIQATLAKAGLICLNRPAAAEFKFSLVAKEEDEEKTQTKRDFTCPYCQVKIALDAGEPDPVKCPECFGIIAKYAEIKERNEIRDRLMNSKLAAERRDMQLSKEEAERERKKRIEQEVAEEVFGKTKQINKTLVVAGGAAILVISGLSYFLTGKSEGDKASAAASSASAAQQPGSASAEDQANAQPGAAEGQANALPAVAEGHTDAQAALQDTHDKANKVLGAFGLDADNLGKNAGKGTAPAAPAAASGAVAGAAPSATETASSSAAAPSAAKLVSIAPSALPSDLKRSAQPEISAITTLVNDGENNQEWDLFLNQHIARLIESNKLADAFKEAQYLADTESYIDTMGQLLAHAQQGNQDKLVNDMTAAIESRINALPVSDQAAYLAQAGFYQLRITKKNGLLTRAEAVWKQIPNPDSQLKAALKIAVYNFKSGNIDTANTYLSQAADLLPKHTFYDQQASARAAVARAYADANDSDNAAQWLASAEKLIPDVTTATLKELIGSYAYANQLQPATLQNIAKEKQGELLYRAVQVFLKNKAFDKAVSLNDGIQDVAYKALASDLIASYLPADKAATALDLAEKQLQAINLPADKAIATSRLARHYARIGNMPKAATFVTESERQLSSLSSSSAKDDVLALVIKNFAQALQFDTAENLTVFIQGETVKSSVRNDISRIKELGNISSL